MGEEKKTTPPERGFAATAAPALAVALAVPLWSFLLVPHVLEIPDDFSYSADIVSVDNFYDERAGEHRGEQFSKTRFSYEVVAADGDRLTIRNAFEVQTLDGEPIFKVEPLYGIDAATGAHVRGLGDRDREGYLFAPRGLAAGEPFTYWHASADVPARMAFVGEERLYGLDVYRYESDYGGAIDQTAALGFLPEVGETRGIKLLSKNTLWVEPVTGYLVRQEDFSVDYYYYDLATGARIGPHNKFSNTFSDESVRAHVDEAARLKRVDLAARVGVPVALALLAALVFLLRLGHLKRVTAFAGKNRAALIILAVTLVATFAATYAVARAVSERWRLARADAADAIESSISDRLDTYVKALVAGRALFDSSDEVSRGEWRSFFRSMRVGEDYPGVQGFGFAKVVSPEDREAFVRSVRDEGFPDFDLRPAGERDRYTSIVYLEPLDARNQRAFGFDMFSEETRRAAMVRARDSGEPSASGRVSLLQEDGVEPQPGFLIYVPVYRDGGVDLATPDERARAVVGYVYSPFRLRDLMRGIFGDSQLPLDVHVHDGLGLKNESLLYDSGDDGRSHQVEENPVFRKISTVYVAGHPWTIEFRSDEGVGVTGIDRALPWLTLLAGLTVSLLAFGLVRSATGARARAVAYADALTADLKKGQAALVKKNEEASASLRKLEDTKRAVLNVLEDAQEDKVRVEQIAQRLELASRSAKIGVWEWGVVGNVLRWDDQMYALYGIRKEDFSGAYEAWQSGLHPEDRKSGDEAIRLALEGKKEFDTIFRVVWPSGEVRYIEAHALVERDPSGAPLKMVGVNFDVTHDREVDRQKSEFVSLASHQLKTPVGAMSWNLEMLIGGDYGPVSGKQREVLAEMYGMSRRMNDLVNGLLNISRLEMGTLIVEPEPTDWAKLCDEVLFEMDPRVRAKRHDVTVRYGENLPSIPADQKLLRVIFQNYISNAIKYTPENGKISVSIEVRGGEVLLSVANSGAPIPEKDQPKIFGKMFRASNAQEQDPDGNGLGLYLVKKIIESAGGKAWFESVPGRDTVFYASFPVSGMARRNGAKGLA